MVCLEGSTGAVVWERVLPGSADTGLTVTADGQVGSCFVQVSLCHNKLMVQFAQSRVPSLTNLTRQHNCLQQEAVLIPALHHLRVREEGFGRGHQHATPLGMMLGACLQDEE